MPPHTARSFDIEFNHLRRSVGRMSTIVAGQWRNTVQCLMQVGANAAPVPTALVAAVASTPAADPAGVGAAAADPAVIDPAAVDPAAVDPAMVGAAADEAAADRVGALVQEVLEAERDVNRLQVLIHRLCNQLIVRHQPIAVDLREAMSILHMVSDFERVGDEAKKSVLRIRRSGAAVDEAMKLAIVSMVTEALEMLDDAFSAFLRYDPTASAELRGRDRDLDERRRELSDRLLDQIRRKPATASACLDMIMVVGSVERVGDHAKNVARYVVSVVKGIDRRAVDEVDSLRPAHVANAPTVRSVRESHAQAAPDSVGPAALTRAA